MKFCNYRFIFILLVLIFLGCDDTDNKDMYRSHDTSQSVDKKLEPTDWNYLQRSYPNGKINAESFAESINYRKKKVQKNRIAKSHGQKVIEWQFAGPTNVGGRVTDIEKNNSGDLYIGSASGGIYKSINNSQNWVSIFDEESSLSIGDIAIAPTNDQIIYVGTGEANAGGASIAYDGYGIYKSYDGGGNWTHLGLEKSGSIGKILVHPDSPDIVYVGAVGNLFSNNSERGLYKSLDGGNTWQNILYTNDSTGVVDMLFHPENPEIIYATTWERVRRPNRRSYGGASSGIFRSMDAGSTWTQLSEGLPEEAGRIGIAISASQPDIMYAMVSEVGTDFMEGVYRSNDGGDSWIRLNRSGIVDPPFMWWFGKIYIDPLDPEIVYLPSLFMHRSNTGGSERWATIFADVHQDQHVLYIDSSNPEKIILGNDGGVYVSDDHGINYDKMGGLPITQFYTCEIDYSNPERLYGGTQDNGTIRTLTGAQNDWHRIYSGDGFNVIVDPTDNSNVYVEFQWGNIRKSIDGGETFVFGRNGVDNDDRFNWKSPLVLDPQNPITMYFGSHRLYKSTNGAFLWHPISPDLTGNPEQQNLRYGTLTTISVSPLDQQKIWVGTDNGRVQMTDDGGETWWLVSDNLPNRWVTNVTADPNDSNAAYATYSGYRFGENEGHIFHTTDNGDSWTSIGGDLPDVPINDLVIDPVSRVLYLATDIGVFDSNDNGESWNLLGLGLPNVVITDLDFHPPTHLLVAASFGKGLYKTYVNDQTTAIDEIQKDKLTFKTYPNPFRDQFILSFEVAIKDIYSISVYDFTGQLVRNVYQGELLAGSQKFEVIGTSWPDGIYFCKIESRSGNVYAEVKMIKD